MTRLLGLPSILGQTAPSFAGSSNPPPPKATGYQKPEPNQINPHSKFSFSSPVSPAVPRFDQVQHLRNSDKYPTTASRQPSSPSMASPLKLTSDNTPCAIRLKQSSYTTTPFQRPMQAQAQFIKSITAIPRYGDATPLQNIVLDATPKPPQISYQGALNYTGAKGPTTSSGVIAQSSLRAAPGNANQRAHHEGRFQFHEHP